LAATSQCRSPLQAHGLGALAGIGRVARGVQLAHRLPFAMVRDRYNNASRPNDSLHPGDVGLDEDGPDGQHRAWQSRRHSGKPDRIPARHCGHWSVAGRHRGHKKNCRGLAAQPAVHAPHRASPSALRMRAYFLPPFPEPAHFRPSTEEMAYALSAAAFT
jgi:hypothetical protein